MMQLMFTVCKMLPVMYWLDLQSLKFAPVNNCLTPRQLRVPPVVHLQVTCTKMLQIPALIISRNSITLIGHYKTTNLYITINRISVNADFAMFIDAYGRDLLCGINW